MPTFKRIRLFFITINKNMNNNKNNLTFEKKSGITAFYLNKFDYDHLGSIDFLSVIVDIIASADNMLNIDYYFHLADNSGKTIGYIPYSYTSGIIYYEELAETINKSTEDILKK